MTHKLKSFDCKPKGFDKKMKEKLQEENHELNQKIIQYQRQMYAQGKYSMLIVFQGMDASWKDGAVKGTFSWVNPMGAKVAAFKVPNKEEFAHDFLWRIHEKTPEKGMIQIFNRSHYEDVLVPYVEEFMDNDELKVRCKHINNFEELLNYNNTIVLKFYLHISSEEQQRKLNERLTNPTKYWKHEDDDYRKSGLYEKFQEAYEFVFDHTHNKTNPWNIIQADNNTVKVNQISKIIVDAFENKMKLEWPDLDTDMKIVQVDKEEHKDKKKDKHEKKD